MWQWLTFTHTLKSKFINLPTKLLHFLPFLCTLLNDKSTRLPFPKYFPFHPSFISLITNSEWSSTFILSEVWVPLPAFPSFLTLYYFDPILPKMGVSTWFNCSSSLYSPDLVCQRHKQEKERLDSSFAPPSTKATCKPTLYLETTCPLLSTLEDINRYIYFQPCCFW